MKQENDDLLYRHWNDNNFDSLKTMSEKLYRMDNVIKLEEINEIFDDLTFDDLKNIKDILKLRKNQMTIGSGVNIGFNSKFEILK